MHPAPICAFVWLHVAKLKLVFLDFNKHEDAHVVVARFEVKHIHDCQEFNVFNWQCDIAFFEDLSVSSLFPRLGVLLVPTRKLPCQVVQCARVKPLVTDNLVILVQNHDPDAKLGSFFFGKLRH